MSALAGIQSFQPLPPAAPEILSRMAQALTAIAPDGGDRVFEQRVAMAYGRFHVTGESRRARQPYAADGLLVTWDGRLDNRDELARMLTDADAAALTDVELVCRAYQELGSAAIARLVGDFALALWDRKAERLILARDALGGRPLFYRLGAGHLLWASTLSAMEAAQTFTPEIDEEWIAAYLIRQAPLVRTPYRDVQAVPAGHLVIAERRGVRSVRFWTLGAGREIRYRDDAEYEEHFRELFFAAVRGRLRTGGAPVCAELSGGLDSSSVACVADHLLRTESVEASDLITCSIVYERASTADEREFIRPVEARLGRRSEHILEDEHPMLAGFEQPWSEVPYFLQTLRAPHQHASALLRERQTRVVLSGLGGDQLMWAQVDVPWHLADLAGSGRLGALWRELRHWRRRQVPYPEPLPQLVLRGVVRPLVASLRGHCCERVPLSKFPYLTGRLRPLQRKMRQENLDRLRFVRPSRLPCIQELHFLVGHVNWLYQLERLGLQMSHPFLHRPLVEFCLAIPNDQFVRVHETRSLQRRALRGLLPPEVVDRTTKTGPDEAIIRGFRRQWPLIESLLADSRVCARGLADRTRLHRALERTSGGIAPGNMDLVRLLEVEIWLRARELRPRSNGREEAQLAARAPAVGDRRAADEEAVVCPPGGGRTLVSASTSGAGASRPWRW